MTSNQQVRPATILIAEHDRQFLSFLTETLRRDGYEVTCAESGDQAMEVLLEKPPFDLALFDVNMPSWNGFSLCSMVKADTRTRSVPVALITSVTPIDQHIEGLQCGADEFLNKSVKREELLARVRSLLKVRQAATDLENSERALLKLALSIEARDPYTHEHCDRLMRYSAAIADELVMAQEQRVALRRAAVIHDIGKVELPDSILLKPGALTEDERAVMQQHPIKGESICAALPSFCDALPIVRHHHERMDGTGYPDGLKGDQIPVTARIFTLVDVYDALTTDRPFRRALPRPEAMETMHREAAAGWLDPDILEVLEFHIPRLSSCPCPS